MAEKSISFIDSKADKALEKSILHQMFNATIWCTFDVFYIQYMLPILLASINASGFIIGITLSSQTLGLAIAGPIIGKIIDNRSNIALVIFLGCLFKSISLTILYLGFCLETTSILIIGMFCIGLSITAVRDSLRVIVSDHTSFQNRSEYLGKLRQRGGIGALIGWSIGFIWFGLASTNDFIPWNSHIHTHWWFRTVVSFSIFVIGCVFSGLLVSKYIKIIQANSHCSPKTIPEKKNENNSSTIVNIVTETISNGKQVKSDEKNTHIDLDKIQVENLSSWKNKQGFVGLLLLLGFERFVGTLMRPFAIVFLVEKLTNYSETILLLCYTPGGLLAIMMSPLIGRILDKKINILPRYILCIVSFMGAGITVAFIYCNTIIQIIFIVIGDCTVITVATLVLNKMISTLSKKYRGTVFGMSTAVEQTCTMIGPIVGGILWDCMSHTTPFWASVFAELFIGVIYVAFFVVYPLDALVSDNI